MTARGPRPHWSEVLGDVAALGASIQAENRRRALTAAGEAAAAGQTGEMPVIVVDAPPPPSPSAPAFGAEAEAPSAAATTAEADTEERRGRRLLRDNLTVGAGTALSRITGVGRVLAVYGMSDALADVYLLANNTPNIIYELILGGILTATLVPLFTQHLEERDEDSTSAVVSVTLVALVGLTLLATVVAPLLILLYGSNSDPAVDDEAFRRVGLELAVLFAPQVFFYGAMALGSALLNARRRFFAAAWSPVLNNLIVIGVLVGASLLTTGPLDLERVEGDRGLLLLLGLGTTAGIAGMALALLPALWRAGVRIRFRPRLRHPAVRAAARLSGWTLGYVVANQVAAQTVLVLAVSDAGTVRAYQVAFIFFQLPHGLLAVSLMTTFQPDLARAAVQRRWETFHDRLLQGLRLLVAVMVPAATGYLVLATLAIHLLPGSPYEDGRAEDVARALAGFAPGLIGFSLYLFVLRGFYATQDTRRPFWINAAENGLNVVAALALAAPFGLLGLTSAYSIAYLVAAGLALAVLIRRLPPGFDLRGFVRTLVRCLVAAAVMAAVVVAVALGVVALDRERVDLAAVLAVPAGAVAYLVAAAALGVARDAGLAGRLPGPLGRLAR